MKEITEENKYKKESLGIILEVKDKLNDLDIIYDDKKYSETVDDLKSEYNIDSIVKYIVDIIQNKIEINCFAMENIGFKQWDSIITLIPVWIFKLLPNGLYLISIDGEKNIKTDTTDIDSRFGCVAYGFTTEKINFINALKAGYKVRRQSWDSDIYLQIITENDEQNIKFVVEGELIDNEFSIDQEGSLADDWELYFDEK